MVASNADWPIKACIPTDRRSWWDAFAMSGTPMRKHFLLFFPDSMVAWPGWQRQQDYNIWHDRDTYLYTWRLCCHHGRWGRHVVRVGGRCEGWINPPAWRLRLGVRHEGVIYAYRGGRVVVLVDRASAGVLVTIHKHVQERLRKIIEKWQLRPCTTTVKETVQTKIPFCHHLLTLKLFQTLFSMFFPQKKENNTRLEWHESE